MSEIVVHHCITCGYAKSSTDKYKYHIIQHEDGACLPVSHHLRCKEFKCAYVRTYRVKQHSIFEDTGYIRNFITGVCYSIRTLQLYMCHRRSRQLIMNRGPYTSHHATHRPRLNLRGPD